jgi:hypothetical protein
VVALEQAVAAPLATCRLADAGARVIKIERDRGDFARHYDTAAGGESAYFAWLNRGKESIVLDIKDGGDRTLLDRLLRAPTCSCRTWRRAPPRARPGIARAALSPPAARHLRHLGLRRERPLPRSSAPTTSWCRPRAGWHRSPAPPTRRGRVGVSACDIAAGLYSHAAILEALLLRQRTGKGKRNPGLALRLHGGLDDGAAGALRASRI